MSIFTALLNKPISILESKINEAKNQAKAEIAVLLAKVIVVLVIGLILLIAVSIASVGLALFINYKIDHPYMGYFYVGLGYLVLAITFVALSKSGVLKSSIEAAMKKKIVKEEVD